MSKWAHIYIEGYYMLRTVRLYDKKSKRPAWCVRKFKNGERCPEFRCLWGPGEKMCPFFGLAPAEKDDVRLFDKAYAEAYKEDLK